MSIIHVKYLTNLAWTVLKEDTLKNYRFFANLSSCPYPLRLHCLLQVSSRHQPSPARWSHIPLLLFWCVLLPPVLVPRLMTNYAMLPAAMTNLSGFMFAGVCCSLPSMSPVEFWWILQVPPPPWTKRIHISLNVSLDSPLQSLPPDPTTPQPPNLLHRSLDVSHGSCETGSPVNGTGLPPKFGDPHNWKEETHLLKDVCYCWWLKSQTTTWDGAETLQIMG